jgi:hypothetical protein
VRAPRRQADALRPHDRNDIRRRSTGGNVNGATREGSHEPSARSATRPLAGGPTADDRAQRLARAGRRREVSGGRGRSARTFPAWFTGGVSAHELDDVVDVVVNLTYRTDRAIVDAVRGRRLHAKADLT